MCLSLFGVACVIYFVINFSLSCVVRSIRNAVRNSRFL